jgi:hypothetical protein
MTPLDDAALCIELGRRAVTDLMTQRDWDERIERVFSVPPEQPLAASWER